MTTKLSRAHQRVYDAILRHPMSHNLDWRDVRAMLGAVSVVVEEANGNLKYALDDRTIVLHPSPDKDIASEDELMELRRFLQGADPGSALPPKSPRAEGPHLLVVLDHREARIYHTTLHGSVPTRVTPYDPYGFGRSLHYVQDDSNGQRKPERKSFYEAIAKTLRGAEQIVLFGSGTGASSAMEQLIAELKGRHPDLAQRIVGSRVVDEHHLTDDQLLAQAREFYFNNAS